MRFSIAVRPNNILNFIVMIAIRPKAVLELHVAHDFHAAHEGDSEETPVQITDQPLSR